MNLKLDQFSKSFNSKGELKLFAEISTLGLRLAPATIIIKNDNPTELFSRPKNLIFNLKIVQKDEGDVVGWGYLGPGQDELFIAND